MNEMQRKKIDLLLSKLRKSLLKERQSDELLKDIMNIGKEFDEKAKVLQEVQECSELLGKMGINPEPIKDQIIKREEEMLSEMMDLQKKMKETTKKHDELLEELETDKLFYKKVSQSLSKIEIKKNEITYDEFIALLYFAKCTGIDRTEMFENFSEVYPEITREWDERGRYIDVRLASIFKWKDVL